MGSYFGAAPPEQLEGLKLFDMNDFDSMMKISVIMGAGHLVLANLITAWRSRASTVMLAPLGWIVLILAGVSAWLRQQVDIEWAMLAAGVLAILLCSSHRPWQGAKNWMWRLIDGLMALTGLSKMFGDVLSYLRLFALGLASASLAIHLQPARQRRCGCRSRHGAAAGGVDPAAGAPAQFCTGRCQWCDSRTAVEFDRVLQLEPCG